MVSIRAGIGAFIAGIALLLVVTYRKQLAETGTGLGSGLSSLASGLGDVITKPGIAFADVAGRLLGLIPGIPATPGLPFGGIAAPPNALGLPDASVVTPDTREQSDSIAQDPTPKYVNCNMLRGGCRDESAVRHKRGGGSGVRNVGLPLIGFMRGPTFTGPEKAGLLFGAARKGGGVIGVTGASYARLRERGLVS